MKAEPALAAAQDALNTLNKGNLTELKSFGSPPGVVTSSFKFNCVVGLKTLFNNQIL